LLLGQLGNAVVGATNLEGEHRLQVLALEQDLVAQTLRQLAGEWQGSFLGNVVDARGEDLLDVLFEHRGDSGGRVWKAMQSTPSSRGAHGAWRGYNSGLRLSQAFRDEPGSAQAGRGPGRRRPHSSPPRTQQRDRS